MLSNSVGEVGTRRMTIFLPSVEPMPIDANDLIDATSENTLPEPLSLKMYEPVRDMAWWCGPIKVPATTGLDIAVPWSCVAKAWP